MSVAKVVWRCAVLRAHGAPCAMTASVRTMLESPASVSDSGNRLLLHTCIGVASLPSYLALGQAYLLDFQHLFFSVYSTAVGLQSLTATLCGYLSTHILYSAAAAALVQSRLREPCSVYYFASFDVRHKVSSSFVPAPPPGAWRRHFIPAHIAT